MSTETRKRIVKATAFAVGLVTAALVLTGWRVSSHAGNFGAEVSVTAAPTGELSTPSSGPFVKATGLRAGGSANAGTIVVNNISPKPLAFHMRARPSIDDLNSVLQVDATVGDAHVYQGTLGGLTKWTASSFVLTNAVEAPLKVKIWLPRGVASDSYDGRIVEVDLEFETVSTGGSNSTTRIGS